MAEEGRVEEAETRGPSSRVPPPPHQKRSLEILVLAGSAVLETLGLGDPAGRGRRLWAGGSGN